MSNGNGVKNDQVTTLMGVLTGIMTLIGFFGIGIPAWIPVVVGALAQAAWGFFTNKVK